MAAIELNVSCPNVHSGLIVGEQPSETEALLQTLRPLTEKALIVKLTPNVADPAAVAVAAEQGGADAVSFGIQHAEGERDRPGERAARSGRRPRRSLGAGGTPDRLAAAALGRRRDRTARDWHGRNLQWRRRRRIPAAGAALVAVGTENFATRAPARE